MELNKIYKISYFDASYVYLPLDTSPAAVGEPDLIVTIGKVKRIESEYVDINCVWEKETNNNSLGIIIPTSAISSYQELYEA
jgi:hypothetical protein